MACACLSAFAQGDSQKVSNRKTFTLNQILDSARANSINVRTAQIGIKAAEEQRKEAFTKYFPNVNATGMWFNANRSMAKMDINLAETMPPALGASLAQTLPPEALVELGSPVSIEMMKKGTIAGVSAVQPVFAGGQIVNGNRLAKVGEEASKLQLQLSENEVERTAEQYFWQIVALEETMNTILTVEKWLKDICKDVNTAVEFNGRASTNSFKLGETVTATCVVGKKLLGGKRLEFLFPVGKYQAVCYVPKSVLKDLRTNFKIDVKLHPSQHR